MAISGSVRSSADRVPTASGGPLLTASQLRDVTRMLADVDSVELKVTVPDAGRRAVSDRLGMDVLDAKIRQVFFFDTARLDLNDSGVVVRARRIQGRTGDAVVKVRPFDVGAAPKSFVRDDRFVTEIDAMPGGFVCSGSLRAPVDNGRILDVYHARGSLRRMLTKSQRALFKAYGLPTIDLDELLVLGPVNVLKLKFGDPAKRRRMAAELWFYPDGSRILELSTKCRPADAVKVAEQTRSRLTSNGVDLSASQLTKTKSALEYFAGQVRESSGTPA
jgi:hypothetical protein